MKRRILNIALAFILSFSLLLSSCEDSNEKSHSNTHKDSDLTVTTTDRDYGTYFETKKNSTKVYVSKSGNKIHRIPNCSGMKNYSVMSYDDAVAAGYALCKNCY